MFSGEIAILVNPWTSLRYVKANLCLVSFTNPLAFGSEAGNLSLSMPHLFQCHLALIPPLYVLSVLPGVSLLQIQPRDLPASKHSVWCLQRAEMLLSILLLNLVLCLTDAKSSPKEDLEGGLENLVEKLEFR